MEPFLDRILGAPGATPALFSEALLQGRARSILLECPDLGLGRALAKAFVNLHFCRQPRSPQGPAGLCRPCGSCQDCLWFEGGAHPGLVRVEPDGQQIRIGQVREEILGRVGEKVPGERTQVFVIDGADRLTEEAANALLKIVEEPPPRTLFLLVVEDLERVLGTIRSRCGIFSIPRPPAGLALGSLAEDPLARILFDWLGAKPELLEQLEGLRTDPYPKDPERGFSESAAALVAELSTQSLLDELSPASHSVALSQELLKFSARALQPGADPLSLASEAHRFVDRWGKGLEGRWKALEKDFKERFPKGYQHPRLKRIPQMVRAATTAAAEDLFGALTTCLAWALRQQEGLGRGLEGRGIPGLEILAGTPRVLLLERARVVRKARIPLVQNQNLRLLFEELFLRLGGLGKAPGLSQGSFRRPHA